MTIVNQVNNIRSKFINSMILSSPAFKDQEAIPDKYSYHSGNISPPLHIDEVPTDAVSLALVCHDPDAPKAGGFTHWILFNISPETELITENTIPEDAELGMTDWGDNDWGGPAPPSGTHHYEFCLYALDKALDLPTTSTRAELLEAIEPHIIETASLVGIYSAEKVNI